MKKALKWLYMLNKRLYKKASFIVILALLLVSVVAFTVVSKAESGFVHIVLAQNNKNDKISSEIVKELLNEDSLARFTLAESVEAAIDAVKLGEADTAWIFPEDMGSLSDFTLQKGSVIRVVEREQNVFLRLSREKLNSVLFKYSARAFFLSYADEKLPTLSAFSDEELLTYFENAKIDEDLFIFENPITTAEKTKSSDYLSAPLRGLLGVITVLSGMAGLLYYMNDESKRHFSNISLKGQSFIAFASVITATLNISLVALVSLFASGLYRITLTELAGAIIFAVCTASFLMVLKEIFGSIKAFGAVIPALVMIMCVVCPVFFNIKELRLYSFIFPPTYYINCAANGRYLIYMLAYSAVCLIVAFLIKQIRKIRV